MRGLRAAGLLGATLLAGCTTLAPEAAFDPVAEAARQHLGHELRWARSEADRAAIEQRVATLLAQPLGMDEAVQLALLNSRGLQAAFQELGIADAERVQAGRLPNPGFGYARLQRGDTVEWDRSLSFDLAALLSLPLRREAAQRQLARRQAEAAAAVLAHAAGTRRAWVQAVAAEQSLRYAEQVAQAAEAGSELARRMQAVGNFSALQRLREQAFHAEATLALGRAQRERQASRERLTRLLGLWGDQLEFRLPERLPDLPAAPREWSALEQLAVAQRLDLQAARQAVAQSAAELAVVQRDRLADGLALGVEHNSASDAPTQRGWTLGLELPLFDTGSARAARAEAQYRQARDRAAQAAIDARSEVREAYAAYRSAWDAAVQQRDELVPLHQRISEQNLLRYNGMLIGVFELLADARAQVAAVDAAIGAQRDFWIAHAELEQALLGRYAAAPGGSNAPAVPADAAGTGH